MHLLGAAALGLLLGLGAACPVGTYESLSKCQACQAGRYSLSGTSCSSCAAGRSSSAGAGACCPTGSWSAPGTTTCTACLAGTASATLGASSAAACLTCPAGTWSSAGAAACVSCEAGKSNAFAGSTVSSSCSPCAANTYSAAKAAACTPCAASTYSTGGAVVCCALGSWSAPGALACTRCVPGTYSATQGATASSFCTPCDAGFYNPNSGSASKAACLACPAGTGGASLGLASLAACASCPSGKFAPSSGSSTCDLCTAGSFCTNGTQTKCPPGYYSGSAGATACSACGPGTVSGEGVSTCTQCSAGTVSGAAASVCEQCSAGTYSSSGGVCEPCSAGYYSGAGAAQCTLCSPGTWSGAGSSACTQCPIGTYGGASGLPSAEYCTPCSPGTFNPTLGASSIGSCLPCAPGTFADAPNASSCTPCLAGTASDKAAAASAQACQPCAAGSFADSPGAPACSPCERGSFSTAVGASSNATCTPCPDNGRTLAKGASEPSQCLPFQCPACQQPRRAAPPPRSLADCEPTLCAPPLVLQLDPANGACLGCAGCPPGTAGSPATRCAPCPANATCPGFLAAPLPPDASALAAPPPAGARAPAGPCLAASGLPALPPPPFPGTHDAFSHGASPPSLATLAAGGALALALLALHAYVRAAPLRAARLAALLKRADAYALAHAVAPGSPLLSTPTPLGGACTLLSLVAFAAASALLIVQHLTANVVVQSALNTLLGVEPFAPGTPFGALPAGSPLAPALSSGLQLQLLAQAGLNCSAPLPGTLAHLPSEPWALAAPPPPCSDGRTLLRLTCPACALSAASFLAFALPYTCQAFLLELTAVDAQGAASTVVFPPAQSTATGSALLASLAWEVQPLATLLSDAASGRATRGYRLFSAAAAATRAAHTTAYLSPADAAVRVSVTLAPQPTYAATTLLQRQSPAELLTAIVGLLGILGVFRVLFSGLEGARAQCARAAGKRRPSAAPPGGGEAEDAAAAPPPLAHTANPLRRAPADAVTQWRVFRDADSEWFVSLDGTTSVWALPAGGEVVP